MANLRMPNESKIAPDGPSFGEVWFKFFDAIRRKFNAGAAVTVVTTADAASAGETQALVNELKAKVNALIQAQQA